MLKLLRFNFLLLPMLLCLLSPANAAVLEVSNLNDSGTGSLRAQVLASSADDTIYFAVTGTIVLTTGVIRTYHNLNIIGPGWNQVIIDGNNASGIFQILAGDGHLQLYGLHLTRASSGAVYCLDQVSVANCEIDYCTSAFGGAIYTDGGTIDVTHSSLHDNTATSWGGALYAANSGTVDVSNTTLAQNSATSGGAIFLNSSATGTFINVTVAYNTATIGDGGGVRTQSSGELTIGNTIIANNYAPSSANVNVNGLLVSLGYNLIDDVNGITSGTWPITSIDIPNGLANFDGAGLKDNGRRMQSLGLSSASICIDRGTNAFGVEPTDQRGAPRELDGTGIGTVVMDMGAVEFTPFCVTNAGGGTSGNTLPSFLNTLHNFVPAYAPPFYICFNLVGGGPYTIQPFAEMAAISNGTTIIDGYSQPGSFPAGISAASLQIEVSGAIVSPSAVGFTFSSAGASFSELKGICIDEWSSFGVRTNGCTNVSIAGNYIGTDVTGAASKPNATGGLSIESGSSLIEIGGSSAEERNVISGNLGAGITLSTGTSGIKILNNYIGLDATGVAAVGNSTHGVFLNSSSNNFVGAANAGNYISGNSSNGIFISNNASDNKIQANVIGLNVNGDIPSATNNIYGISISGGAANNLIGGISSEGNIVSGNNSYGIYIVGVGASNLVENNFVGIDLTGILARGNGNHGIYYNSGSDVTIGTPMRGNVVGGNIGNGIQIEGSNAVVQGNICGVGADGVTPVPNSNGIYVAATGNTIGGLNAGEGNWCSGNTQAGIEVGSNCTVQGNKCGFGANIYTAIPNAYGISVTGATNLIEDNVCSGNSNTGIYMNGTGVIQNVVINNIAGLDTSGVVAVPNTGDGIFLGGGATSNLIGGTHSGNQANFCSGNGVRGIYVSGSLTADNDIFGNIVGLNRIGNTQRPNAIGIEISQAQGTAIGGGVMDDRNIISGNTSDGIVLNNTGIGTTILGNYIGVDITGTTAIPNTDDGIDISNSTVGVQIGGSTFANVIAGNGDAGISISSDNVVVQGNHIGQNAAATPLPNATGIEILGGSNAVIGGVLTGEANVIASNTSDGIVVSSATAQKNAFLRNSIYSNGGANGTLGIDFSDDGVTPNDAAPDADTGPNSLQNYPVLNDPSYCGTNLLVSGSLTSMINTDFNIDFYHVPNAFAEPSGYGEGNNYIGSISVTTDAAGFVQFNATLATVGIAGDYITAIATEDAAGLLLTSSEFSEAKPIQPALSAVSVASTDVSCFGSTDGTLSVSSETGGASPYSYLWDTGTTGSILSNVPAGSYTVTVSDANGCAFTTPAYTVNSPLAITPSISITNESCDGLCDGAVDLVGTSGGTGALSYGITGGSLSSVTTVGGLCGTTNSIQIQDGNGCIVDTLITINPGIVENSNLTYAQNNWCASDPNIVPITTGTSGGSFSILPAGLSYNTSTGVIDIASSAAGNYTVTYTTPTCGLVSNFAINLQNDENASFNYAVDSFCVSTGGAIANITGVTGGTFSSSISINPSTGEPLVQAGLPAGQYYIYYTTAGACPGIDSVLVTAITTPDATILNPPASTCDNNGVFTLTALNAGGVWSGNAITDPVNGVFDPNNATVGQNMVIYTLDIGVGCSDADTIYIEMFQSPQVTLSGGGSYCNGDTPPTIDATFTGSGPFSTFDVYVDGSLDQTLNFSGNPTQVVPNNDGTITVGNVTDNNGCVSGGISNSVVIGAINPPNFVSVNYTDTTLCGIQTPPTLVATTSGGGTITWYDDVTLTNVVQTGNSFDPTIVLGVNTFYVVEEVSGCIGTPTIITITELIIPMPQTASQLDYCIGDFLSALNAFGSGLGGTMNWYADAAQTVLLGTGQNYALPQDLIGTHYYYVNETLDGCVSGTIEVQVNVYDGEGISAGEDVSFCTTDSVQLNGIGVGTVNWFPGEGLSDNQSNTPYASPDSTTLYIFHVLNSAGCLFWDSVIVEVLDPEECGLHVYNSFSPEGDGINDYWSIEGIGSYPENSVIIFGRWGDVLREFTNYNNADVAWDGTNRNGENMPVGTYYYIIKLTEELSYNGWVYLNR